MAVYQVPVELYEFYAKIRSPLARRMAILMLEGRQATTAYKTASKEQKRKLSKDPAKSAYKITSNGEFSRFMNLAKAKAADEAVNRGFMSFMDRANMLQEFATIKLSRARASDEPVNCSDAIGALGLLHKMLDDDSSDKLAGLSAIERQQMAIKTAKKLLLQYDND